ncbi:RNA-binding KH domain-containing protein, putative isoform 3 [Hibiscus syriacus]|uniref:RNA-binding KH domain-containing protein, putative isoform 3 n=1 Tax=Hibiscus syriacus TaxID=106335 RepID=A0A6A2ZNC7_HIBSY|nr:RNA-binding KH domain-containing protein, putative isoform 3 [Hibiscus syriacus]
MSTKVDQTPAVGPHVANMSATTMSSTTSTTSLKVSRFAAKTGFVIPKNKLSGSLVPIFRGGKQLGGNAAANEDNMNQSRRKTKGSPDLTQDDAVRRGRALAYQTRVYQIMQQLKSGTIDVGDTEDPPLATKNMVKSTSDIQPESEKLKLLEIERQETIGEILKLNPSYKAPADYKPLLKEATVSIPAKEYPGCNFVSLIFGPGSDTKKQLEKVAETFEKVDGAVALIELPVSSIPGNFGTGSVPAISGNDVNARSQTPDTAVFPMPQKFSAPILNSPVPAHSSLSNPSSLFGPRPAPAAGYNTIIQDSSLVSSSPQLPRPRQVFSQPHIPPMHPLGHTGPPQNFLVPNSNLPSTQPGNLSSLSLTGSQPQALGPLPGTRPLMPAGNVGHLAPPAVISQVPNPVVPRPVVASGSSAPPNILSTFSPGPSGPRLTSVPVNHPSLSFPPGPPIGSSPALSSVLHPTAVSGPMSVPPPIPIISQPPPTSLSPSLPRGPGSLPGNIPNFGPINQPAARSQHSSSGDFTFQPHQTQGPTYQMVPRPGSQAANPHALAPRSAVQQAPPFQFGVPNSTPQPAIYLFPRPQNGNQIGLPQTHMSSLPNAQQNAMSAPPRPPAFPGGSPLPNAPPVPQMGFRNFVPSPKTPNMAGPFSPRPGHSLQHQQHYPALPPRPVNFPPPNPQFSGSIFPQSTRPTSGSPAGQQVYDSFSPTSVPGASQHQRGGKANAGKHESDPEYEDLMVSME